MTEHHARRGAVAGGRGVARASTAGRPRRFASWPAVIAASSAMATIAGIYLGSRGLRDFDSALVGYAAASVFAVAAIVYRYSLWLTRPPTWRYFRAAWAHFLSWSNFRRYTVLIPLALWRDLAAQGFLVRRARARWAAHMAVSWAVLLSLLITFPLTFGWIRFTLLPPASYELRVVGLRVLTFPIEAGTGFALFHALDVTAVVLLVGVGAMLWRRLTDVGLLTTQRFGFDLLPLVLLFAIAVTGLALTGSSLLWEGRFYWFVSLAHQVTVVAWLLSLPFGKLFHIVQRPASVGVTLYQTINQGIEVEGDPHPRSRSLEPPAPAGAAPLPCRRCGMQLPSATFVRDLKATLVDLGQRYDAGGGSLHDHCPTCKRVLRGQAYFRLAGRRLV